MFLCAALDNTGLPVLCVALISFTDTMLPPVCIHPHTCTHKMQLCRSPSWGLWIDNNLRASLTTFVSLYRLLIEIEPWRAKTLLNIKG